MKKKDIIRLLESLNENDAEMLSEKYFVLSEQEHERILHKIENKLPKAADELADIPSDRPAQISHLDWLSHVGTAVACVIVFCGTFAGLFWLKAHAPVTTEDFTQTSVSDSRIPVMMAYAVGERYAADNLTASGSLYVTVTNVVQEDALFRVDIVLESEEAISYAMDSIGEPYLYFADNFQLMADDMSVSPCRMQSKEAGELPYTFALSPSLSGELSLWYSIHDTQLEWKFTTGTSDVSYTIINLEELP